MGTVLAPAQFGQHVFQQGLLVGRGSPSRHDSLDKLLSVSEEGGGSKERCVGPHQVAEVIIPLEDPLPSLPDLQQERAMLQRRLADSLSREKALRAELRACQFPLPSTLETPRSERA